MIASTRAILGWWVANFSAEGWVDWPQVIDIGEPCCWRCGWWSDGNTGWRDTKNPHGLERGHLVNDCCGGSAEPSNLVMLCYRCNRMMPTFSDRVEALRWVMNGPGYLTARWIAERV